MSEPTETSDLVTNATQAEPEIIPPATPLPIAAVHVSFFGRVVAEFKRIFKGAPSFTSTAAATMTYLAPFITMIVTMAAPGAAPEATLILAKVQSAFSAASVLIKQSGSQPTIVTYLDTIRDNVTQLESVLQIKDPETQQKIAATVTLVVNEIDALLQNLHAQTA